jgi:hypothetical protein
MKKSGKHSQTRSRRSRRRVAAATGTTTKARPEGVAENHDFAVRMRGKLPEAITSEHLELLNSGLQFLFADLRTACETHAANRREGELIALGALMRFVSLFETTLSEQLHLPILALRGALFDLEENIVGPSLQRVKKPGRSRSSMEREALKGHVAATAQRLFQAGMSTTDAHDLIAKELKKLGVKPERGSGDLKATTVRDWCDEVAADVSRAGVAANVYDGMFTEAEVKRFKALASDQRRKAFALESLRAFVRKVITGTLNRANP